MIAWVIGNMVGGIPYEYTDKEGNKTTVAAYEHVVILTGYSLETSLKFLLMLSRGSLTGDGTPM